ncbi:hypothetical protein WHR41_08894 [Cladosporium halotolerans]|uniref:Ionotropic glutamate receptor C-terminal domain-containing protein n=1 Tax=Cladosporium halotolerans TaxID=1052096 RepID=A0AB34KEE6_9PEZI
MLVMSFSKRIKSDGARRYMFDIWQPLLLLMLMTIFTATFYSYQDPFASSSDDFFCNADGNVQLQNFGMYKPFWDPNLFFTINIPYGTFSFTAAKIIDAGWDLVVGRGGQMVAALMAYRILRRSLTLILENRPTPIGAVTAFCCQQVSLISGWELLRTSLGFGRLQAKQSWQGRRASGVRIAGHLVVFAYVLSFATLASVMTGYQARLSGVFDYNEGSASQVKPLGDVYRSELMIHDGRRIGLAQDEMRFRGATDSISTVRDMVAFLRDSGRRDDPYGTLVDYFYTCAGLQDWAISKEWYGGVSNDLMTSNITLNTELWTIGPPLLNISGTMRVGFMPDLDANISSAESFFNGTGGRFFSNGYVSTVDWRSVGSISNYGYNGLGVEVDFVKDTGRCIADEAYSWGFSSLLLLTFCSSTLLFALVLILLQTDVYWNSHSDRDPQHYSIYSDILWLAKGLSFHLGTDLDSLSPKDLEKRVENDRMGIVVEVDELRLSRYQLSITKVGASRYRVFWSRIAGFRFPRLHQWRRMLDDFNEWRQRPAPRAEAHGSEEDVMREAARGARHDTREASSELLADEELVVGNNSRKQTQGSIATTATDALQSERGSQEGSTSAASESELGQRASNASLQSIARRPITQRSSQHSETTMLISRDSGDGSPRTDTRA